MLFRAPGKINSYEGVFSLQTPLVAFILLRLSVQCHFSTIRINKRIVKAMSCPAKHLEANAVGDVENVEARDALVGVGAPVIGRPVGKTAEVVAA